MIRDNTEFNTTLTQLAGMYSALAALQRDRSTFSDEWFAVMAEGPLEEIRRMESEISAYVDEVSYSSW